MARQTSGRVAAVALGLRPTGVESLLDEVACAEFITVHCMDECRLDKWLWSTRVYKTRAEATAACRGKLVKINELEAKPGRDVNIGEVVKVRIGLIIRTVKVLGLPLSRVAARQVPQFMADLTPAEEYEKARQASLEHFLARERGKGRPTKKDRRAMGRLFGFE